MAKKYHVAGEQHYGITGQLLEIQRQLRMEGGSPIDPEHLKEVLQGIIEPKGLFKLYLLEFLRASGYLDTSFEGKETQSLTIRPLTKEQAFEEYRNSGGNLWLFSGELEKNMPYTVPRAETLDVMILNFGRNIRDDEAIVEMDKLGVRTLLPEQLIQYGIARRNHQKRNLFVSLVKIILDGVKYTMVLGFGGDGACELYHSASGSECSAMCRFPVVCK